MFGRIGKGRDKRGRGAIVGVSLDAGRLAAAACREESDGALRITAWEVADVADPAQASSALRDFVERHGLRGHSCRWTLAQDDYSLRLVDRPPGVPDEELAEATRWLVRDLVEFDVETARIATMVLPEDATRARTPRVFMLAARAEPLADVAEIVHTAGLELVGIEIVETAMLSLETCLPEVVAGSAMLRPHRKSSALTLSRSGQLYLTRALSVDDEALERAALAAVSGDDGSNEEVLAQLDALLLEVQRSLDYYESEYGQAPASRITLLPSETDLAPLAPVMADVLRPLQVEVFDLTRLFEIEEPPRAHDEACLAIAVGGALTKGRWLGDDLLTRGARRAPTPLGLAAVARVAAVIAVGALVTFAVDHHQLQDERHVLSILEAQRAALAESVQKAHAKLAPAPDEAARAREIEALEALRDARLRILRDLERGRGSHGAPFSSLLEGLARQDLDGIWLERIHLARGGDEILLEGRTLRPDDLPVLLRRLGTEPGFADRRFRTFRVERPTDGSDGLRFRIATPEPQPVSPGAAR